jgi:hypothetical protein
MTGRCPPPSPLPPLSLSEQKQPPFPPPLAKRPKKPPKGGYTTGRADLVALLRQRARPYLFSNTLAPAVAGASLAVFDLLASSTALRDRLEDNTRCAWGEGRRGRVG